MTGAGLQMVATGQAAAAATLATAWRQSHRSCSFPGLPQGRGFEQRQYRNHSSARVAGGAGGAVSNPLRLTASRAERLAQRPLVEHETDIKCLLQRGIHLGQLIRAKAVACGDYHTLCLAEEGRVYAWGGTLYKKTGDGG